MKSIVILLLLIQIGFAQEKIEEYRDYLKKTFNGEKQTYHIIKMD